MAPKFLKSQITRFKQLFLLFDKDGDGYLTREELLELVSTFGQKFTPYDLLNMMEVTEAGIDGAFCFSDLFKLMMYKLQGTDLEEQLKQVFKFLGKDDPSCTTPIEAHFVMEYTLHRNPSIQHLQYRYWRFCADQGPGHRWSDEGPPPVFQLTFHSNYDCNVEPCMDPTSYLRVNSAVYFIPKQRLVEPSDGDRCLLSDAGKKFVASLNRIVDGNHANGYCIAPSINRRNVVVSLTTGECMLLTTSRHRLGEIVDGELMTRAVSYTAVADFFESLLQEIEGGDILGKLCDSVQDLLMKMRWCIAYTLVPWIERLIQYHPCLMGTEAIVYLIREADIVLRREFKYTGIREQKHQASYMLRKLPYLCSESDELWTDIAQRQRMLNYWYSFRANSLKVEASSDVRLKMWLAWIKKSGKEKLIELEKSGAGLVSLHRDALNHPYEAALKEMEGVTQIWPYNLKYVVDVLTVNYPRYQPNLVEIIASCGNSVWDRFALHTCFPRNPVVKDKICGLLALLMKLGRLR